MDPTVYVILSLDTNLEVTQSVTLLFDREGQITRKRSSNGDHERVPLDELDECLEWSASQLNEFYTQLYLASQPFE